MHIGQKHSEETKKHLSMVRMGRKLSHETRRRMSVSRMGHTVSEETREKIRSAELGKKKKPHTEAWKKSMSSRFSGPDSPNYGRRASAETRERLRQSHLGNKPSEETRAKMSAASMGHPCSPLTREKIRQTRLREKHWNWKGGRVKRQGYVFVLRPEHPGCTNRGYIAEHRIVTESCLGRFLKGTEEVHHVNGTRDDNRPENLMVFRSRATHVSFDKWGKASKPEDIIFDGRELKH